MAPLSRAEAQALDAADPLARFRVCFVFDDGDRIYVDGNSLGRLPRETIERLSARVGEWGSRLVTAWPDWIDLPRRVGDRLADVVGARPGEVVLADSTTVNLYKLALAASTPGRAGRRSSRTRPTSRPIGRLRGHRGGPGRRAPTVRERHGRGPHRHRGRRGLRAGRRRAAKPLARLLPLGSSGRHGGDYARGARGGSVRALGSESLGRRRADRPRRRWCGPGRRLHIQVPERRPGAPAFLYVRSGLEGELRSPIWGWFGQREQFAMGPEYDPAPDVTRFLAGTPPVLDLAAVEAGVDLVLEAGLEPLREKSVALTKLVIDLYDEWLAPLGFGLGTPRNPARRGSHVSLLHDEGWRICRALIERAAVVPDFRRPDSIRYGLPPLYTRYVDAWDAVDRLRRIVEQGDHMKVDAAPARVT